MKKYSGAAMLLLTAMIWGAAFVAQSVGMDYVGPFTFNSARYFLGALVLLPVIALTDRGKTRAERGWHDPRLWLAGVVCGIIMAVATSMQQVGLIYTTVGKAGFITTLYVVLVPIVGLFFGKKVRRLVWLCVVLAVFGLYLLCMSGSAEINAGDLLMLGCAITFTFHILCVDRFSPLVSGVKLSMIQFLVAGIACAIPAAVTESSHFVGLAGAWESLLYTGILSCGVGYTFQILGQRSTDPTVASIIMCMESVFAVLFGWLLLKESLSPRELLGCTLMFAAILISQLPEKKAISSPEAEI